MPNNNPQQTTPQQTTPQQTTAQQQIARAAEGANKAAARLGQSAEHATSAAIEKVRRVRDDAQSGIEQQRSEITERIRRLGGVLRASSETLSTDDPLAQQLFASAGDRIDQVAEYVGRVTPSELANDVTSLARRRPGLFFGGSFILGLALGRFVKSSAGAASRDLSDQGDEYEDTLSVRPAPRRDQSTTGQAQPAQGQVSSGAGAASGGREALGAPSYGAASSVTTASRPAQSSSSTPASSAPRDVERGEGSKS